MNYVLLKAIHNKFGTQGRFAAHIGISECVVSRHVRGARMDVDKAERWAAVLGVPVDKIQPEAIVAD